MTDPHFYDPSQIAWPDLLVVREFLDTPTCRRIVAEMNGAEGAAATVYGRGNSGLVDQSIRQTLRIRPSVATVQVVIDRLLQFKPAAEKHFDVALSECEDPQFLHYREGDFFVAHQDGNTGLLRLDTERRRVSTVIFLSRETDTPQPDAYCGGSLLFTDRRRGPDEPKVHFVGEPGTLIAFRAETTHEVTPVTYGERYSIVSWFR
jgi:predicted 2-oxoglutarate/Fe(II)-dependent dioxygenase YbiX